jgi:cytochrome P450
MRQVTSDIIVVDGVQNTINRGLCAVVLLWLVRRKGEIYPCKPDIFKATYNEVDEYTQTYFEGRKLERK